MGATDSRILSLVVDADDRDLGEIPLSRNADVCMSLRVDFAAVQMRCPKLKLTVFNEVGDAFGLMLHGLHALHKSEGAGHGLPHRKMRGTEHLTKTVAIESY